MSGNLDYKDNASRLSKRGTINDSSIVHSMIGVAIGIGIVIGLLAGSGAVSGVITNYFLGSYIASLSPFIIGGIIGSRLPLLVVGFLRSLISNPSLGDSIKEVPKLIIHSCPEFAIGMGLVTLGFTSPAAIGALSALFGAVARITINSLIRRFNPDTNIEIDNIEDNSTDRTIPCN